MPILLPTKHSMLRRCKNWDYHSPRIYSITITLANRNFPLLGTLKIDSPENTPPERLQAHIEPTALGAIITDYWHDIARRYPEIQILGFQLMEEHLHGALYVTQRLKKHLGIIIGGFKGGCTAAYRKMTGAETPLFSPGFQDTILFHRQQLERMLHYIHDNPRRLAIKRLFPVFFQHLQNIPFQNGSFNGVGNPFLLYKASYFPIQASRNITDDELNLKWNEIQRHIKDGAVIVSPCISQGEKKLARHAFECQASLIVLRNMCFSPLFKPPGAYYDACANGKLLMIAPSQWPYTPGKKNVTRNDACVLNYLTMKICGMNPDAIHYTGYFPGQISALADQAMGCHDVPISQGVIPSIRE